MDLPADLRKFIYEEALVFKDSWSCTAQILATCKQVHNEATYILYGANLIEIHIHDHGVETHGYSPGMPFHMFDAFGRWPKKLMWHNFLRRAKKIRVTAKAPEKTGPSYRFQTVPDAVILNQIVYTLCSFLEGNHTLQSFELDLRASFQLDTDIIRYHRSWPHIATSDDEYQYSLQRICYPLVMLGQLPHIGVDFSNGNNIRLTNSAFSNIPHAGNVWAQAWQSFRNAQTDYLHYASDQTPGNRALMVKLNNFSSLLHDYRFFDESWEGEVRDGMDELSAYLDTTGDDSIEPIPRNVAER